MAVEFRLLGDVEACLDGHRLEIGHARPRCVLLALLVDVNRPVSTDQLVDRVWADQPPHRARNALAGYISRLRRLFAPFPDVTIVRESGGYELTTDPSSVDLHRFRQLATPGRRQPATTVGRRGLRPEVVRRQSQWPHGAASNRTDGP
jgi:DNA-binding SARP family transcriptional activator